MENPTTTLTQNADLLREKGIKVTPQRIAVYDTLKELGHASVEEVTAKVTLLNPTITTATVYNVLSCFAEKGIINRLSTTLGRMYYDITTHKHHHLICDNEECVVDFEDAELTRIIDEYLSRNTPNGFHINKVNLQLIGTKI